MNRSDPSLLAEFLFRLRGGPLRTARWISERLRDGDRDKAFGIQTAQRWGREKLRFASQDSIEYQAITYRDMREILALLEPSERDVLIDLGSGMGRAVCIAATFPFQAVIGVEIAGQLHRIAQANLQRLSRRVAARRVDLFNIDATEYSIPNEASIIFFFNPFSGASLNQVLSRIEDSVQRSPRRLRVVFAGTLSARTFESEAAKHRHLHLIAKRRLATGLLVLLYSAGEPEKAAVKGAPAV